MLKSSTYTAASAMLTILLIAGCSTDTPTVASTPSIDLEKVTRGGLIWSDCELFGTIGTPTSFDPDHGPFDELYSATFLDSVLSISESKPGDRDYNGGRWHVNALRADVDPNKYVNVCQVSDLDLSDFESTDTYFECPLLPRR